MAAGCRVDAASRSRVAGLGLVLRPDCGRTSMGCNTGGRRDISTMTIDRPRPARSVDQTSDQTSRPGAAQPEVCDEIGLSRPGLVRCCLHRARGTGAPVLLAAGAYR